jgi:phosphatidylglycerophosphatase A
MTDVPFKPAVMVTLCNPVHFLSTGMGSGLLTPAPGTWGSAVACLFYIFLLRDMSLWLLAGIIAAGTVAGVYICGRTAADWQVHDHGSIVWDEWMGQWIALLGLAAYPELWLPAFLLFRLFDIWKPGIIGWTDRQFTGGFGIMADDILAGMAALASVQAILWALLYLGVLQPV